MRTACGRVHIHKHMQNEVNKALISMGSNIVNNYISRLINTYCQEDQ